MTPSPWPALVAAVEHSAYCDHWRKACMGTIDLYLRCSCDRDARIARRIEAAVDVAFQCGLASDGNAGDWRAERDAAAARAFEAAT